MADAGVLILEGEYTLKPASVTHFDWEDMEGKRYRLDFEAAYTIEPNSLSGAIRNCVYQVSGQRFKDLSFMKGKITKQIFAKDKYGVRVNYDVIRYPSGIKSLKHYHNIPTFDSDDREWDGDYCVAIYQGETGINLLHSQSGYKIPRIHIFLGLKKSEPDFSEWLGYLT